MSAGREETETSMYSMYSADIYIYHIVDVRYFSVADLTHAVKPCILCLHLLQIIEKCQYDEKTDEWILPYIRSLKGDEGFRLPDIDQSASTHFSGYKSEESLAGADSKARVRSGSRPTSRDTNQHYTSNGGNNGNSSNSNHHPSSNSASDSKHDKNHIDIKREPSPSSYGIGSNNSNSSASSYAFPVGSKPPVGGGGKNNTKKEKSSKKEGAVALSVSVCDENGSL